MRWRSEIRASGDADDEGSAVIEFVLLAVVVLVPFAYGVLCVLAVERAAFGLTAASREAGRAFVTAPAADVADERAHAAVELALDDHGVPSSTSMRIDCSADPCLTPDARVTVVTSTRVRLPLLPDFGLPADLPVQASHSVVVDRYREVRP